MPSSSAAADRPDRPDSRPSGAGPRPWEAVVAAGVGLFGVLPLFLVLAPIVLLGGLTADTGRDPWVYPLFLAPLLVLVGSVLLLVGRTRVWLVVGAVAAVAAGLTIIGVARSAGESLGAWPLMLAVCPVLAAGIALRPAVGRWLAQRRRPAGPQS